MVEFHALNSVALRFDFLVFVHELVNELDHKGASSMLGCDCLVVVEFHALNAFSFLFSILLLISAASELLCIVR